MERLPGTPYLLAGPPYATDDGDRVRRTADGQVTSAGELRLTRPEADGADPFDARADLTQEQAALTLAADPRGYGNPDEGWRHLISSPALEAGPAPGVPQDLHVLAVRHGPAGPFAPGLAREGSGPLVRTEAFTAVVGEASGDARGEPEPTLRAA